jgi:hypothetical protein
MSGELLALLEQDPAAGILAVADLREKLIEGSRDRHEPITKYVATSSFLRTPRTSPLRPTRRTPSPPSTVGVK